MKQLTKKQLIKIAKKELKRKKVKTYKKQVCSIFKGKDKKDCLSAFDKSFIDAFVLVKMHPILSHGYMNQ